jgi:hypothetical protein
MDKTHVDPQTSPIESRLARPELVRFLLNTVIALCPSGKPA